MKTLNISQLLKSQPLEHVEIKGWVRTFRANRFIALNDGSSLHNIQCVVDFENTDESILKRITTGAAVSITGELIESQGKGQNVEINVKKLEILGDSQNIQELMYIQSFPYWKMFPIGLLFRDKDL